jgi:hypothetical protein
LNRILKVWVVDPLDYFLLSAIIGSITASCLKDYLSEKKAMKRLKRSIIKKSKSLIELNNFIPNSKQRKIKRIYEVALSSRGGQFENFQLGSKISEEAFMLAQHIKTFVERLAVYLKKQELKGVAKIFFKNGRILLELLLYRCKIDLTYVLLNEGLERLNSQIIVINLSSKRH